MKKTDRNPKPITKLISTPGERKPKVVLDEDGDELVLDNIEDLEDLEDSQKLDEFRAAFGERNYFLRIERWNSETNEMELCERVTLQSFDPLTIGRKYGGGKFVATLFNDGGKYVKGGRMRFVIAKPLETASAVAAPQNPMENPVIAMMLEQMRADKAMMSELLKASLGSPKESDIDKLLGGVKTIMDLNPKEKDKSLVKELGEMMMLQKQFKEMMGGGDDDKGTAGNMMAEFFEAFKMLKQSGGLRRAVPPPGSVPRATAGTPIVTAPPKPTEEPVSTLDRKIKFYLPALVEAAVKQEDAGRRAGWLITILENEIVPAIAEKYHGMVSEDSIWEKLIEAGKDADKVQELFVQAPELEPHRAWVLSVIDLAIKEMTEEPVPVGENGNGDAA